MTGYTSKRRIALDRLDDDDIQVYAQPEQEPVAIHQFRAPHCSDWYDGIPDHHDGHGPYEVRTLYTNPPAPLPVQEPVAHVYLFDHDGKPRVAWDNAKGIKIGDRLYATPPAAQPDYRAVKTYHEGKPVYVSQPEQRSAFGWIKQSEIAQARLYGGSVTLWLEKHDCDFPVYTTPPAAQPEQRPWVGLTDEEMTKIVTDSDVDWGDLLWNVVCLTKIIEAALKEKNFD